MPPTTWRKSSRSADADHTCVEVAFGSAEAAVRDSKNRAGPTLSFAAGGWRTFARWTTDVRPFRQRSR